MDLYILINFVAYSLTLVYTIFMLMYLNETEKCDLDDENKKFRKAAVVITWIQIVFGGLFALACLLLLIAGPQQQKYILQ